METLDRGRQGHCCNCGLRRQGRDRDWDTRDWDNRHWDTENWDTRDRDSRDVEEHTTTLDDSIHGRVRIQPRYNQ